MSAADGLLLIGGILLGLMVGLIGMAVVAIADPEDRLFWQWPAIAMISFIGLFIFTGMIARTYPAMYPISAVAMIAAVTSLAGLLGAIIGWIVKRAIRLL